MHINNQIGYTEVMSTHENQNPLDKAIAYFDGNQAALARAIDPDLKPMTVTHWKNRRVPPGRYFDIQEATDNTVTVQEFYEYQRQIEL